MPSSTMKKSSMPKTALTAHIRFLGHGRGSAGERFVKLAMKDGSRRTRVLFRVDNFGSGTKHFDDLNREGAYLVSSAARAEFSNRLQNFRPAGEPMAVATQVGPVEATFVLPDGVISMSSAKVETYLSDLPAELLAKYRCEGDLEGWQELARCAAGNSRFIFALSLAFLGPLAAIIPIEHVAAQLVGPSGIGKSGLAATVSSVWGWNPKSQLGDRLGFGETWSTTLNALEPLLAAHNYTLLLLDETRNTGDQDRPAQTILDALMKIESGIAKGRLKDTARRVWFSPVLSTSNMSVVDLLQSAGQEFDGAYADRMIDVPPPSDGFGIYETLHQFDDVAAFTAHLKGLAAQNFGTASRWFLWCLYSWAECDRDGLIRYVRARRTAYLKKARKIVATGRDLTRVHGKCASVYAVGCIACDYEILPFRRKEILEAILKCEADHAAFIARESVKGGLAEKALAKLEDYVAGNVHAFVDLRKGAPDSAGHTHTSCAGYIYDSRGAEEYLFSTVVFDRAAGGRAGSDALKRELAKTGALKSASQGARGRGYVAKRPVMQASGKLKRQWVIAIDRSAVKLPGGTSAPEK